MEIAHRELNALDVTGLAKNLQEKRAELEKKLVEKGVLPKEVNVLVDDLVAVAANLAAKNMIGGGRLTIAVTQEVVDASHLPT